MKKADKEIQYLVKAEQIEQPQSIAIQIACLSFFPLLYFVGKAVLAFVG